MARSSWRWGAAVLAALMFLGVGPASAHTDLAGSTPAADEVLASPPAEIVLRFNEEVLDAGAQVVARQRGGPAIPLEPPVVHGKKVSAAWKAPAADGAYVVAYRVVAGDGHPIEGEIPFSIEGSGASQAPSATPAPGAEPSTAAADPTGGASGGPPWGLFVIIGALLLGGYMVWRARVD